MEVFRVTENVKKKFDGVWGELESGGFVGALGRRVSGAGCGFRAGWHSGWGGGVIAIFGVFLRVLERGIGTGVLFYGV